MRSDEPGPSRGRILLIDDDRVFGIWVAHVVAKRGGYEFRHIMDPLTGLRCVETEPWDLVITDMEMPGMTGLELIERVHRCEPGLPVAVMTAPKTVASSGPSSAVRSMTRFASQW